MAAVFDLQSPFAPAGDQPQAIAELTAGLRRGDRFQTLLGVTGSGKTMTVAHVIRDLGKPTLVLSHNKTLAAQLYGELKSFFPHNAVEYFISYYDYYQPEAYVPTTDTYIEKDASINEDIDRLRLRATSSLMEREDVVIVATVSAIYGLGDPVQYREQMVTLAAGQRIARDDILRALVEIQYHRNDVAFDRGTFRVRGDTVEILPAYEEQGVRVELWGDEIERHLQDRPADRRGDRRAADGGGLSGQALRDPAPDAGAGGAADPRGAGRAAGRAARGGQAARSAAAGVAHQLRPRDDARDRHLRRHRELLAPPRGPGRGRAPVVPVRLLPRGLPRRRRRVARHAAADRRDVQRRPRAQADARRLRLPPAERARQPAADVRRVPVADAAGALRVGHAGRARAAAARRASSSSRSSGPRAWSTRRSRSGPVRGQVDDLLGEIRRAGAAGRAGAGHHAHQAHGRGSDRLPAAGRGPRALHALRHRRDRAHGDPARPAAGRVRRAGGHQPAARGARPARGLAGRDPRRRPGGLPAQRPVADPDRRPRGAPRRGPRDLLRRPRHRLDAAVPRRDRAAAARSRWPTTWSTASRRGRW